MILSITLTVAGAAALLNIWLMIRVGQVRTSEKVSVGDGGNEKVIRRMRAHSNYIETAPFVADSDWFDRNDRNQRNFADLAVDCRRYLSARTHCTWYRYG